jgi:vacuolar-type H+-ATPase subunit H
LWSPRAARRAGAPADHHPGPGRNVKRLNLRLILLCAGAALALIAAGCGGDDDDSPELTKDEFITQADEICTQGEAELTAAAEEQFGDATEPPSKQEREEFVSTAVADSLQAQLDDIRELNPPADEADQVNEILDKLQQLIDRAREDPAAVLAGEETEASQLATDFGLTSCGS